MRCIGLLFLLIGSFANSASVSAYGEVDCFEGKYLTLHKAQQCASELKNFEINLNEFRLRLATFAIDVTLSVNDREYKSHGSGFLVSHNRNYIITAKHVIIGTKPILNLEELGRTNFIDFESAIEDLFATKEDDIQSIFPGTGKIVVRPFTLQSKQGLSATVVAFDRSSDLALLHVKNLTNQAYANPTLFRAVRLATRQDCRPGMEIQALGYKGSNLERSLEMSHLAEVTNCHLTPQTALIGGKYFRIPLYETNAAFDPGMSGGPVIVYDSKLNRYYVVGVVGGGVPKKNRHYFIPASAVVNLLERFGAHYD
jgi:S1-C subfamily serine protease